MLRNVMNLLVHPPLEHTRSKMFEDSPFCCFFPTVFDLIRLEFLKQAGSKKYPTCSSMSQRSFPSMTGSPSANHRNILKLKRTWCLLWMGNLGKSLFKKKMPAQASKHSKIRVKQPNKKCCKQPPSNQKSVHYSSINLKGSTWSILPLRPDKIPYIFGQCIQMLLNRLIFGAQLLALSGRSSNRRYRECFLLFLLKVSQFFRFGVISSPSH